MAGLTQSMKTKPAVVITASLLAVSILIVAAEDAVKKPDTTEKAVAKDALATNYTTICYLEKHDCTITVKAGAKGTVYSAKKKDGKVLCENASLEQLRAQAPDLHQFIKSAIASNFGKNSDARLDASIR